MPLELPPGTAAYSHNNPPPRNRQLILLLGLGIGVLVGVIFGVFALVGAIADQVVWWIPAGVEQKLGALVVPAFAKQAEDSPAQATLNQLLDRLETHLPPEQHQNRDYQVLYIPDSTVNALALPGDRIVIYAGLLNQMESENELMMVMGHELGHFAHRDHLRGLSRGLMVQVLFATVFGDVGSLTAIAASGVANLSQAHFSQSQETQADTLGLKLLQQTYGHVAGATDFFDRLSRQEILQFDFLATHPTSKKRVAQIQHLIRAEGYRLGERSPLPETLTNLL